MTSNGSNLIAEDEQIQNSKTVDMALKRRKTRWMWMLKYLDPNPLALTSLAQTIHVASVAMIAIVIAVTTAEKYGTMHQEMEEEADPISIETGTVAEQGATTVCIAMICIHDLVAEVSGDEASFHMTSSEVLREESPTILVDDLSNMAYI